MSHLSFLPILAVLLLLSTLIDSRSPVPEAAAFAISHLQTLSDSGVYQSLSLKSILSHVESEGRFYDITSMILEIESPYFASGLKSEEFEVVVMEGFEEGDDSKSE
jgi:hypothetical protein